MKTLLAVALIATFLGPGATEPPSPAGTYRCRGTQGGESYGIRLVVTPFHDGFAFAWKRDLNAPSVQAGLAVMRGTQVAVAIMSARGGQAVGLYTMTKGRLDGVWTGNGAMETEVCVMGDHDA